VHYLSTSIKYSIQKGSPENVATHGACADILCNTTDSAILRMGDLPEIPTWRYEVVWAVQELDCLRDGVFALSKKKTAPTEPIIPGL
jgi:hypothetical protein